MAASKAPSLSSTRPRLLSVSFAPRSLDLCAGELDDPRPLLGFVGNELAEVGGRPLNDVATHFGKPRPDVLIGETAVDYLVEQIHRLDRSVFGCANAEPGVCFEARQEFGDRGNSRHVL